MSNYDLMVERLTYLGGQDPVARMKHNKAKTLEKALLYSSQSETVIKDNEEFKVLINDKTVNQEYDEKMISCPSIRGLETGDIIHWVETNTDWIIYLQETIETAYFLGYMRKCKKFFIEQVNQDKNLQIKAAVIGPDADSILSRTVSNTRIDFPNLQISLMVKSTAENRKYFTKYSKFVLKDKTWEVQSVNDIDIEDVLIISALETYEIIEEEVVEPVDNSGWLEGSLTIKPLQEQTYTLKEDISGEFLIEGNPPITILNKNSNSITLKWNSMKSGSFVLVLKSSNGSLTQMIKVDSLF